MRVRELAEWLGATYEGDGEMEITGVAPVESAEAHELSFATGRKGVAAAEASAAGCLIVGRDFENARFRTLIRVEDPRREFARAIAFVHPPVPAPPGIHPTASLEPGVSIGEGCSIGPYVTIGVDSVIGAGVRIGAGSAIGRRVLIGDHSVLHARVTIYEGTEIGTHAILHSGCVLGADGFGFVLEGGRYEKFPQVGRVRLGNHVEVGANTCIDRAALGITSIGDGVKLDNMVHIGHNCRIGNHVVIAAQTGLSGGVVVEDFAVIGGQVGIGDKVRIESKAVLGSGCGILTSKIVRAGQVVWGTPARPLKEYLEQLASQKLVPALRSDVRQLKDRVTKLETKAES